MRDEEEGIFKEFCELVKMYMWQTRGKKNHLNYSNIKLNFKSSIFHAPNIHLIILYDASHWCPVKFLISFQCTLHFVKSTVKKNAERESRISLQ